MKINEFLKKGKYKGKEMEWKINTGKCFPCFVEIWNHIKSFLYFSYKHFLCVYRHLKSLLFRDKRETYRDGEQLHEFITIKFFTREMCTIDTQYKAPTSLTPCLQIYLSHLETHFGLQTSYWCFCFPLLFAKLILLSKNTELLINIASMSSCTLFSFHHLTMLIRAL